MTGNRLQWLTFARDYFLNEGGGLKPPFFVMDKQFQSFPDVDDDLAKGLDAPGGGEIPDHIAELNDKEQRVWEHVTKSLALYGLAHKTDSMLLTVICRTFVQWLDACEFVEKIREENGGNVYVKTPNGYQQPHQAYYDERSLRKELKSWLPEAALTVLSFQKIMNDRKRANDGQGELPLGGAPVDDPVSAHRNGKPDLKLVGHG